MKFTHKLCGTVLLAVIGTAVVLPHAANAEDPLNWDGKSNINFLEDDGEDKPVLPEEPGEMVEPPINPGKGPLKVIAMTNLEFSSQKVTPATGAGWEYTAQAGKYKVEGNTEYKKTANFVQFKDTRADNIANNHKLTAKATMFTNKENNVLKGAVLNFSNINMLNLADQNQVNENSYAKTNQLATDGTPSTFVNQDDADKGFGQFILQFGDMKEDTAENSVKLWVPSKDNKLSTSSSYESTITWTIADAR